jgi:hypothetical protein
MTKIGLSVPKSAFVNTSELKQRFEKEYEDGLAAASAQGPDAADKFKAEWSATHHPPVLHAGRVPAAASPTTARSSSRSASGSRACPDL